MKILGGGILLAFIFIGCASGISERTIVEDQVVKAPVPVIHDTLTAITHDTVIVATKIVKHDTTEVVKYYPKTNTVTVYAKPDSVLFIVHDTIQTFTGYTDADIGNAKLNGGKWGMGFALIICGGGFLLYKKIF